ncbi:MULTISPECIES: hypothetical protein [unclassified Bartonella]|uniref:hypothetical protein n=1 Tax=unclassified Bartonella TaxID=2645622 RepID=UPI0035D0A40C
MIDALCTFMTRKDGDAKWILYHSQCMLLYIFHSLHCEMEFDALSDDSLKQAHQYAT